jgi:hypothetical protein
LEWGQIFSLEEIRVHTCSGCSYLLISQIGLYKKWILTFALLSE